MQARRLRTILVAFGAVVLASWGGAGAHGSTRAADSTRATGCGQANQGWLFNSYNNCGTLNGAKPAVVALTKPAMITQIADYHFNNGVAVKPGTIGLQAPNGYVFGPFRATQQTGTWDWIANANITVPPGSYTVVDSSPSTWSQNSFSGGKGFVRVFGSYVASAPPVPKPTGTTTTGTTSSHPTCTPNPPSTFLIYPNHVAKGGSTSFLLACGHAAATSFQGSFAPVKVLLYDEASFRNLKYVNGSLQPISPSFPVRAPTVLAFRVVGPEDIDITLPASIQNGTYVPVIVDSKGEVASQNLLVVP